MNLTYDFWPMNWPMILTYELDLWVDLWFWPMKLLIGHLWCEIIGTLWYLKIIGQIHNWNHKETSMACVLKCAPRSSLFSRLPVPINLDKYANMLAYLYRMNHAIFHITPHVRNNVFVIKVVHAIGCWFSYVVFMRFCFHAFFHACLFRAFLEMRNAFSFLFYTLFFVC